MKIQLNNKTAKLRKAIENSCTECPFNTSEYSRCPLYSDTILDCGNDKEWFIIRPADIFLL